ncbi:hypothetical protein GX51_05390 [Blastomyces parvus]|uniref:Short-chain dehydrogenase n=1 Tax=Blastomyces parvus TaxID=2060905 RepID=A0A2B7WP82_9EURO|nr:hypothetical protein GX51_05390 [Blastomyces parvus]
MTEISTQLLLHGIAKLYILSRRRDKYDAAVDIWRRNPHIQLETDGEIQRTEFIQCDLGDMVQVRRAAWDIRKRTDRLDILICNAGLPIDPPPHTHVPPVSPQSIEAIFATNHVGHYILTVLLLPLLHSTIARFPDATSARIVVTASSLHSLCRELDFNLLTPSEGTPTKSACYDGIWRYGRSKLANILSTRELNRRLMEGGLREVLTTVVNGEGRRNESVMDENGTDEEASKRIYVNSFFPGNIATDQMNIWRGYLGTVLGKAFKMFFSVAGQSTQDAAATALYLAASGDIVEGSGVRGQYFVPVAKRAETSRIAGDMKLARQLWDWTDRKVAEVLGDGWQRNAISEGIC